MEDRRKLKGPASFASLDKSRSNGSNETQARAQLYQGSEKFVKRKGYGHFSAAGTKSHIQILERAGNSKAPEVIGEADYGAIKRGGGKGRKRAGLGNKGFRNYQYSNLRVSIGTNGPKMNKNSIEGREDLTVRENGGEGGIHYRNSKKNHTKLESQAYRKKTACKIRVSRRKGRDLTGKVA